MIRESTETTADKRLGSLATAIKEQVDEGSKLLEDTTTRMRVCTWIREARLHGSAEQMAAGMLMDELTKAFIKVWPDSLNLQAFESIEQELPPLRRVRELIARDGLKQWVLVSNEPVMIDTRMPIADFKKALWSKVFDR